jgi:2-dehydro-3-deoxygluconokinase
MVAAKEPQMSKSREVLEVLKANRLVALLAPRSPADCLAAYEALEPLGIVLEIAFRTGAAVEGLRAVLAAHPGAGVLAGTVMTRGQARLAIEAGAAGLVSADYVPAVVEEAVGADVMAVPGGLADCGKQLAFKAELYGCDLEGLRRDHPHQWVYKLFPAVTGSQTFVDLAAAWRGPFPGLAVVHTGGVKLDNLPRLAAADPAGIFCGSALAAKADRPEALAEEAARWLAALRTETTT